MRRACLAMLACLLLPRGSAGGKDPVLTTLSQIEARGGTSAADAQGWRDEYQHGEGRRQAAERTPQTNIRGVLSNLTSLAKRHLLGSRGYPAFLILRATSSGSTSSPQRAGQRDAHDVRGVRADLPVLPGQRLAAAAAGELRAPQRAAEAPQASRRAAREVRRRHARHRRPAPRLAGVRVLLPVGRRGARMDLRDGDRDRACRRSPTSASATATPATRTPRAR